MSSRLVVLSLVSIGLLAAHPAAAGVAGAPAWDLSYRSVLKMNQVSSHAWLAQWIKSHKAPAAKRLDDLAGVAQSAVLLEYPAFHAGERLTFLFARTDEGARCWNFVDGHPDELVAKPLDPSAFDLLVKQLLSWQQGPPLAGENLPDGWSGGYFALLSIRDRAASKQLLLTLRDFKVPTDPQWHDAEPGRVCKAFDPVIKLCD